MIFLDKDSALVHTGDMSDSRDNPPNESLPLLIALWFVGIGVLYYYTSTKFLGAYVGLTWLYIAVMVAVELFKGRPKKVPPSNDDYWRAFHRKHDI